MFRVPRERRRLSPAGFTLIELLIVISIIALLATLAIFAVGSARVRARDAKRIADVKQVMNALELYATGSGGYPNVMRTLGDTTNATCLDDDGFHGNVPEADSGLACGDSAGATYMGSVPKNPLPGGTDYAYSSAGDCSGETCTEFDILYTLEGGVSSIAAGAHRACPSGVDCQPLVR